MLGGHVAGGAQDESGFGGAHGERGRVGGGGPGGLFGGLGEAEVEDLHHAFGRDDDVARFQVAVDDAFVVGGFERLGHLPGDV